MPPGASRDVCTWGLHLRPTCTHSPQRPLHHCTAPVQPAHSLFCSALLRSALLRSFLCWPPLRPCAACFRLADRLCHADVYGKACGCPLTHAPVLPCELRPSLAPPTRRFFRLGLHCAAPAPVATRRRCDDVVLGLLSACVLQSHSTSPAPTH